MKGQRIRRSAGQVVQIRAHPQQEVVGGIESATFAGVYEIVRREWIARRRRGAETTGSIGGYGSPADPPGLDFTLGSWRKDRRTVFQVTGALIFPPPAKVFRLLPPHAGLHEALAERRHQAFASGQKA